MSLSAANVLTEVRSLLNEASNGFWTDTEINSWVSQAAIDISKKSFCVETTATVTLAASTIEYAAPTTFANPTPAGDASLIYIRAADFAGKSLTKIRSNQLARLTPNSTEDTPTHFFHYGERIFFHPVGTGASGTVNLKVAVETDDITDIPDEFQLLAILYGTARGKLKDRKYAQFAMLFREYTSTLAFMRNNVIEREPDTKEQTFILDTLRAA